MHPGEPHLVWHTDLTQIRVIGRRFQVAAVLEGYSRKLLALRVFERGIVSSGVVRLINDCIRQEGQSPRFLITDHGVQFRRRFRGACKQWGITHVRGKVGVWQINAKLERCIRTVKHWQRLSWIIPTRPSVQRRLDEFRVWYNEYRLHSAHGFAPSETVLPIERANQPIAIRQKGDIEPTICVRRQSVRGDPRLFYMDIDVRLRQKFAA